MGGQRSTVIALVALALAAAKSPEQETAELHLISVKKYLGAAIKLQPMYELQCRY